jgi:hypothetical protein
MASPELVPESAYDYAEIIRRGGENGFDEDFMLVKCLHCGELYLYDAEIDTVFTDPADLSRREVTGGSADLIQCGSCGRPIPGHISTQSSRPCPQAALVRALSQLTAGLTCQTLMLAGTSWSRSASGTSWSTASAVAAALARPNVDPSAYASSNFRSPSAASCLAQ